jgi:hypothetical protein
LGGGIGDNDGEAVSVADVRIENRNSRILHRSAMFGETNRERRSMSKLLFYSSQDTGVRDVIPVRGRKERKQKEYAKGRKNKQYFFSRYA